MMKKLLLELLSIPSPTYQEAEIARFLESWIKKQLPKGEVSRISDSVILQFPYQDNHPHVCFIGHTDVIPQFFKPHIEEDAIFGAGASDMKGGIACFLVFLDQYIDKLLEKFNVSLVLYCREENTPLHKNGLFEIIQNNPPFVQSIDLAIIGEPTNNTIQLGCLGSLHAKLTIIGKAAHSARPWEGENALYEARPLIEKIAAFKPQKHTVFQVDFWDVISITESQSARGKTTVPDKWEANINFRYAPTYSPQQAEQYLSNYLAPLMDKNMSLAFEDNSGPGKVIKSPLFESIIQRLNIKIEAKQAWTDVAQLTAMGVPAFNWGPGLTNQAHQNNEHIRLSDMMRYMDLLCTAFLY